VILTSEQQAPGEAAGSAPRGDLSVGKLAQAAPRTAGFVAKNTGRWFRRPWQRFPEIPTRPITPALIAGTLADETLLAVMSNSRLVPTLDDMERIREETDEALAVLDRHGWLHDPAAFHRAPPAPERPKLTSERFGRVRFEALTFESGYEPYPDMPGRDRWVTKGANRRLHAYVMRHRGGPRPWLVHLHGFSMGAPSDLLPFRSLRAFRDLGYNVIHPVLPLHGPRRSGKRSGDDFVTFDYLNNVHGMAQAVWDIRRCLRWVEEQGAPSVAVHGVSLGAYTAALLTGLEPGIDTVIAGVPSVDLAWVMRQHVPNEARRAVEDAGLLADRAERIHWVISPLTFPSLVPWEGRFVYAGVADRMATPQQALRLWKHWDEPAICWYAGSHVGFALSREVRRFVDRALDRPGRAGGGSTDRER
jgi:hypothetical protein